jgi:methyltransferase (TIGR00027 family)
VTAAMFTNGRPSRTGQAVALLRVDFDRPHTPTGDPEAQARLCAGMQPTALDHMRSDLHARTRFFDEQVLAAIGSGTRQIVIVGAGYDDRALRFRSPGVRFIEVDHPATQTDKIARIRALDLEAEAITFGAADFADHEIDDALARCRHDASRPSLFICEGLLVYLDEPTIVRLLAGLRARATTTSTLAASLAVHGAGIDSRELLATANANRRAGATEPWRTILPAAEHLALVTGAGWSVDRTTDPTELDAAATPGHTMLVVAHPAGERADPTGQSRPLRLTSQ